MPHERVNHDFLDGLLRAYALNHNHYIGFPCSNKDNLASLSIQDAIPALHKPALLHKKGYPSFLPPYNIKV